MKERKYTAAEVEEILEYAAQRFEQHALTDLARRWRSVANNFNEWAAVWEVEKEREEAK